MPNPALERGNQMNGLAAPPALLARGVYRGPCLSPSGNLVFFAVDHAHREVEGARLEVPFDDDPSPILAHLWEMLDAADPEHSRRKPPVSS